MHLERQDTFGGLLSIEVFLSGAGGGAFLFGFIYGFVKTYQEMAKAGIVVGVSLTIIGAGILFVELRNKKRLYRVFLNPSSWITRGSWFLTIFIVLGLMHLSSFYADYLSIDSIAAKTIGAVAALFAVSVMSYPGFLFAASRRIPLWSIPGLPLLLLSSNLCAGNAIILIVSASLERSPAGAQRQLVLIQLILIFSYCIALVAFLGRAAQVGGTVSESIRFLTRSLRFMSIVILIGLLIPLGLLFYEAVVNSAFLLSIPAGISLLIGGLWLKYGILSAGMRLPVSAS